MPMHKDKKEAPPLPLEKVSELLAGMKFGTLELTVHGGRVVQIERRERVRISA